MGLARPSGAEPQPHGTRAGRLVEMGAGVAVEYSPGLEAWVEAVLAVAEAHNRAAGAAGVSAAGIPAAPVPPGSAADLRLRRGNLLAAIARGIGLDAPTGWQARTFDTFLGYYEMQSALGEQLAASFRERCTVRRVMVWRRDELVPRLRAHEAIEGFSYDAATDSGQFNFNFSLPLAYAARLREIQAGIDAQRLDHAFAYQQKGNSLSLTAGIAPFRGPAESGSAASDDLPACPEVSFPEPELTVPIIVTTEPAPDREKIAARLAGMARAASAFAANLTRCKPEMVWTIFHETAEVGLFERRICSPDRRWLCEGTANHVAWRVARDTWGGSLARQVYDSERQLQAHRDQQAQIDLVNWPAAENTPPHQLAAPLERAHYAFATRAMDLLAARHGSDTLARIWREVGRTPREKVTAQTFAAAFHRLSGEDLENLIAAAQGPVPPASLP